MDFQGRNLHNSWVELISMGMSWFRGLLRGGLVVWSCLVSFSLANYSAIAGTLVQFRFPTGTVDVELFDQDKPATVQNFLRYVRAGRYQNVFAHRCEPGFVVQGGRYLTLNRTDPAIISPELIYSYQSLPPVVNEYSVGSRRSNTYGTIAMARIPGQTNSASSEWFFNLGNNAFLDNVDGGFTVFGRVVRGIDVLDIFNVLSFNNGIIDMRQYSSDPFLTSVFQDLPVFYLAPRAPRLSELFYVDLSTTDVQINLSVESLPLVTWNSVPGVTNVVEYTTTFPPTWMVLTSTNGNGQRFTVTDTMPTSQTRFYRVRALY